MPRYREPFTIFPRKMRSGKTIYYFRAYTPDGVRTVAHSTGKTSRTQARCYCAELLKNGQLCAGGGATFEAYARGFFSDKGQWMADKAQAGKGRAQPVAARTLLSYRRNCDSIIVPYFGKRRISGITPQDIKRFRAALIGRGMANATINQVCTCLHIILTYALSDKLIASDPFVSIGQMYTDARARGSFTREELREVFSGWSDTTGRKAFALTAAVTGMRISELCAVRKETLLPRCIDIKDQLCGGEFSPVKDGERRRLRVCGEIHSLLSELAARTGFLAFPLNQDAYREAFYRRLGMDTKERAGRRVSFHSLRHFCNTYLLSEGIPEIKVKSAMGHSSGKGSMTERYANFSADDFEDIAEAQSRLFRYLSGGR